MEARIAPYYYLPTLGDAASVRDAPILGDAAGVKDAPTLGDGAGV